ncbi:hypothetical protein SAMN02746065_11616 [Desulfocicer vacuolatum DSM 3385]|uniref:Uncharacterized protein n=1 Tax=Desulfocicer vacuolatum DSM 3385 TaxID=1121400 RepID=A0A1W2D8I3_9BACT|nr:hypothetical protein [Desulfocicer vacuolatum]SMC93827.1 hypothetical protein SAMN02746065_11616 [Desulfocicer vacuolatum DSM 3385]
METLKISEEDTAPSLSASFYKQELNELKIEKLGNRITIISFILPCLIGAILVYAYMDINHRVVDAKDSGKSDIELVSQDMELKINAINVEIAKLKFSLDQQLPGITAQIEELSALKANREETLASLEGLKKEVAVNRDQYQSAIHILDRTSKENLAIINKTGERLNNNAQAFEEKISRRMENLETQSNETFATFKSSLKKDITRMENLDMNLASYEMTMKTLGEDLSQTKKAFKEQLKNMVSQKEMATLKNQLKQKINQDALTGGLAKLNKRIDTRLKQLEKNINKALSSTGNPAKIKKRAAKPPKKSQKSAPLVISVPEPGKISETDLTQ